MRYVVATAVPVAVAAVGLRRRSLDASGAVFGCLIGIVLTAANLCFCAALFTFFFVGSLATKFRGAAKSRLEQDYKEGGQRNWLQVLCNGGAATVFALAFMGEAGQGEYPVDWQHHYMATWFGLGVLGSLAASCGDTLSSEIGFVMGSSNPRLITSFKSVPRGTNGGISVMGTLSGALGGLIVGLAYYGALLVLASPAYLARAPYQGLLIVHGGICGLLGSLIDSFLGATLQYSGLNLQTGQVVGYPGQGIEHISGRPVLDNHGVNLLASSLTGLLSPVVAFRLWGLFL